MSMNKQDIHRAKQSVFPGGHNTPVDRTKDKQPTEDVIPPMSKELQDHVAQIEKDVLERCLILGEEHLSQLSGANLLDSDVVAYVKVFVMNKDYLSSNRDGALNKARQTTPYIIIGHQDDMPIIFAKLLKDTIGEKNEQAG